MIEVALETSFRHCSVALRSEGQLDEVQLDPSTAHASALVPALSQMMQERCLLPREIDAVYVGIGPGSYTGLRVGIATALGLARGSQAELRGEASGESLMWRELAVGSEGVYLLDARQEQFYFARYRRTEADVEVLRSPCVLDARGVHDALKDDDVPIFCDETAIAAAGLDEACALRARERVYPRASALLELAALRLQELGGQAFESVEPLYLREFKAKQRRR